MPSLEARTRNTAAVARYRTTNKGKAAHARANKAWREAHPELKPALHLAKVKCRQANPHRSIFVDKRSKSKRLGITFTMSFDDMIWPEFCPVLGIKLSYARDKCGRAAINSPSFDRLNQTGDYDHDNVLIVSNRANTFRGPYSSAQLYEQAARRSSPDTRRVAVFYETLLKSLKKI